MTRYEKLSYLMAAYFHQDWDLDAPDAAGIVENFVRDEPRETVEGAAEEIALLLASHDTEASREAAFVALDGYYYPQGMGQSVTEWLETTRQQLNALLGRAS